MREEVRDSLAAIYDVSYVLCHVPDLVQYGSKPMREIAIRPEFSQELQRHLWRYEEASAYLPHQVFIGAEHPQVLADAERPWARHLVAPRSTGARGRLVEERDFYAALWAADVAHLLEIEPEWREELNQRLKAHPLMLGWHPPAPSSPREDTYPKLPLWVGEARIGAIRGDHPQDESLTPSVLLENLASKASGALAVRELQSRYPEWDWQGLPYLLGTGEEAVGDRYQRGGGNLAKAVAEMAGLSAASGADIKAFCAAPLHAIPIAAALVDTGVYPSVVIFGGGSLAKLGMKSQAHLAAGLPVLEDVLAGFALWVGPDVPGTAHIRLEAVGRHPVQAGAQPQAMYTALIQQPLQALGLGILDVDRYAVEMHNPDITTAAGGGDVPATNYRVIAALAVMHGEARREELNAVAQRIGAMGFSPTQGHVASAIPLLGHLLDEFRQGKIRRAMLVGKGSLFLGRMTQLSDGMSVLLEANR
jgi:hypothetical protein